MSRVVVIGAGIAGLATAGLLARDGHQVTILEQAARTGGRAGTIRDGEFVFDTGPSWYLMHDIYRQYGALMGCDIEDLLDLQVLDPGYALWRGSHEDTHHEVEQTLIPRGADEIIDLAERLHPGDGAAVRRYLASSRRALDIALKSFLYNPFTDLRTLLRPSVLKNAPALVRWLTTSLGAWSNRRVRGETIRQVFQYPAIFLGADPHRAPAIFHLMSHIDLVEGVRYPQGGFTAFIEALTSLTLGAGVEIQYGARVTGINTEPAARGRRAHSVSWQVESGEQHQIPADIVVSAADVHHTEHELLEAADRSWSERSWRRAVPGPSAVLVMLGIRGKLPDLPHHTLLLTRDWEHELSAVFEGRPIPTTTSLYVCKPSASDASVAPQGHENLFILVPVSGEIELGHGTGYPQAPQVTDPQVELIAEAAVSQLARWSGTGDLVDRIVTRHTLGPADFGSDYNSWKDGMLGPAHVLRQSAMFRRGPRSRRVTNLYYAGSTATPGIGVPMCLISAELILKLSRGDHSAAATDPTPRRSRLRKKPASGSGLRPEPGSDSGSETTHTHV